MAYTQEGKVKAAIDRILKRHGVYYVKPVSNGMGRHGVSDYICCVNGRFFTIEAKGTDKAKPTPLQENQMAAVHAAGGTTFVVNPSTLPALDVWLTTVKQGLV